MKEQHAAEPVLLASIAYEFRMGARIADGNSKVMVAPAKSVRDSGLCARKHENSRFAVVTDIILHECRATLRSIYHHAGQNTFGRTAPGDHARGIEYVDR